MHLGEKVQVRVQVKCCNLVHRYLRVCVCVCVQFVFSSELHVSLIGDMNEVMSSRRVSGCTGWNHLQSHLVVIFVSFLPSVF